MNDIRIPIKMLILSHSSRLVGAETSLFVLLKHLNRNLFEPIVVLPSPGPLKKKIQCLHIKTYEVQSPWWVRLPDDINISMFGYCLLKEISAVFQLCRVVRLEQVDVIYTNSIINLSGAIASLLIRKPHIWHIREIIPGNPDLRFFFPYKTLFWLISKLSNVIIANSSATGGQFRATAAIEKVRVVYNAVDFEQFKNCTSFPDIKGVAPEDWLVAVVGSLQKRKAQDDAIRATKIARENIPSIKLLLVGDGDSKYKDYLERMVLESGLTGNVIFLGYRDDVPQILSHCNVLLMPSWEEPFGRSTIEAMAAGIPVIGADSGGTRELVQHGMTGYLVPPRNPDEIAKKLTDLYFHPKVAQRFGEHAKRVVKERYSPQIYAENIEGLIIGALTPAKRFSKRGHL